MHSRAPLRIGSQLFINRHDSPEAIARWVALMAEANLRLMRLFLAWDHLEPRRDAWQWDQYDAAFAAAEKHGIGVIGTLMSMSPPGWMGCTNGAQEVGDLEDETFLARGDRYIDQVVARWRKSPALDSWILWNEPKRQLPRNAATTRRYREFLRQRYGGIVAYNRDSYRQFESFDDIEAPGPAGHGFVSRRDQLDWMRFATADLTSHLHRIARRVKATDSVHPVHINPDRISQCRLDHGQSIWAQAETVDFLGCSSHPVWHSTRFPRDRWSRSVAMFADLTRGATPAQDGLFWVTELQGGAAVFSALSPDSPSAGELRHWIWESLGSGARAVVFWCFNWRTDGYEAGEWALMGQDWRPTERLREVAAIAAYVERHGDLLHSSRAPVPDLAILVSESSQLVSMADGTGDDPREGRNRQMATDAVAGAYLLATDLGHEVQFIDEKLFRARGCEPGVRTLLVPGCYALESQTIEALGRFVRAGGTIVADHLVAWKTPDGAIAEEQAPALNQIFGGALHDVMPLGAAPAPEGNEPEMPPAWFMRLSFTPAADGRVLGRWGDGSAAVISSRHGAGRAVRLGTALFHPYVFQADERRRQYLQKLIPAPAHAITLAQSSRPLRIRRLRSAHGEIAILLNAGEATTAEVLLRSDGALHELGAAPRSVHQGEKASFSLERWGVRVVHFVPVTPAPAKPPLESQEDPDRRSMGLAKTST